MHTESPVSSGEMEVYDEQSESTKAPTRPIQPRSYQIEMFEHSMSRNIIATLIWFTAPSVVLVQQQHAYLKSHLPQWQSRLITGTDKIELWSTPAIWDGVLLNTNFVVTTPQILLDGLSHGFIRLSQISLLVVDEAHYCVNKSPMNTIMRLFYHPLKAEGRLSDLPHVLGLTASPINKSKLSAMDVLEQNLDATCISPTQQLEDYKRFSNQPEFVALKFRAVDVIISPSLEKLIEVIDNIDIREDPYVKSLVSEKWWSSADKYRRALATKSTYSMDQLKKLRGNAEHLQYQLGIWAVNTWIYAILIKLEDIASKSHGWMECLSHEEQCYLHQKLGAVKATASASVEGSDPDGLSAKAEALIHFLSQEYKPEISCLIFVQRRSTAWALTHVLESHPLLSYAVTSFVGLSQHAGKDSLIDLVDLGAQTIGLEKFRVGKNQICVATSTMEEGLDIQATNIVIRFDDPQNVKSFIQSRGRARHVKSKFVTFLNEADPTTVSTYKQWQCLEAEMKSLYEDENRQAEGRMEIESIDENSDQQYRVSSTGAVLTFDNATSKLNHFCQILGNQSLKPSCKPEFVLQGTHGKDLTAKVILPSSLHPDLRVFHGSKLWCSERAAKKDAAFDAYKGLYQAGLVNDNLLTPQIEADMSLSGQKAQEPRGNFREINCRLNPWTPIRTGMQGKVSLHAHRISVKSDTRNFPTLLLILPASLCSSLEVPLHFSGSQTLTATIEPCGKKLADGSKLLLLQEITVYLLSNSIRQGFHPSPSWDKGYPFFLTPELHGSKLREWFEVIKWPPPLKQFLCGARQHKGEYLLNLKVSSGCLPCILDLSNQVKGLMPSVSRSSVDREILVVKKLPKSLDYLHHGNRSPASTTSLTPVVIADCQLELLPPIFAELVQFIPSILHVVDLLLCAEACRSTLLAPLSIRNVRLVAEALTTSLTYRPWNYERLEFLGDTLLKFYASTLVYTHPDNTLKPEGHLTIESEKLVSNARLQRAAVDIGLDNFMIVTPFRPKNWVPEASSVDEAKPMREVSTKTIADHVEALIAVAWLEEAETKDQTPVALLNRLLPEMEWRLPSQHVASLRPPNMLHKTSSLAVVEEMLGYRFNHLSLLAEALNHSSVTIGLPNYGRLEFLGDAVLDRLVNAATYASPAKFNQGQLHLRQIASVNHSYLAFLCLETHHTLNKTYVNTNQKTASTELGSESKSLWQFMTHSSMEIPELQAHSFARYTELRREIRRQLEEERRYPWATLASIGAPKFFSDIIESTLGAIFVDSGGRLDVCWSLLERLGLNKLLQRLVDDPDIVLETPKTLVTRILHQLQRQRNQMTLKTKIIHRQTSETEGKRYSSSLIVAEEEFSVVHDAWSGEEADHRVCELALERLERERLETLYDKNGTKMDEDTKGSVVD